MRKPLLILTGLLMLLGIAVMVHRFSPVPPAPPPPPMPSLEQPPEDPLFLDPIPPAEDMTTRGFQSGGLGLSRAAWEVLRGKPQRVGERFLYRGQTYSVSYQQGLVWQLKCTWKRPGFALGHARTRSRRYLPLDSQHQTTLTSTAEMIIDQYFSPTLAQRLAQTAKTGPHLQLSLEQQGTYTVTHTLEKERVIATLVRIGSDVAPTAPPSSLGNNIK